MQRLSLLLLLVVLAGCGGDEPTADTPAATATPPAATAEPPAPAAATPFVGSLAVDPGDGTLIVGTGLGLYRLAAGAKRAKAFEGQLATPGAAGAIASNLVLRFTAPGTLIASGHPQDAASGLPESLGLIRSEDGGATWSPVSLLGKEDLHALDVRDETIVGQPVEQARLLVSRDGGATWAERTPPGAPIDVDLDPAEPQNLVLTTAEGLFTSGDGGGSWRQRDVLTTETHLAWSETGSLYRVDAGGNVQASEDGGQSWKPAGNAGGGPSTVTVDAEGRLYVALTGAVIKRSGDGGRSFTELARLTAP